MDSNSNSNSHVEEEPATSWDELYNINLMPSELFLKFRKEIQGVRVALNMEVRFPPNFSLLLSNFVMIFTLASNCCMQMSHINPN
jgi:hypothetical protein